MSKLLTNEDWMHPHWNPPVSWFVSRVLCREISNRLPDHPEAIDQSINYLREMLHTGDSHCSPRYLRQWLTVLDGGVGRVQEVLTSPDDDQSQVLRSCLPRPLGVLLSPIEVEEIRMRVSKETRKGKEQEAGLAL